MKGLNTPRWLTVMAEISVRPNQNSAFSKNRHFIKTKYHAMRSPRIRLLMMLSWNLPQKRPFLEQFFVLKAQVQENAVKRNAYFSKQP